MSACRVELRLMRGGRSRVQTGHVKAVVVQLLSRVRLFVTPWTAARQASLFLHHLPEFAQTYVHRVGDAI